MARAGRDIGAERRRLAEPEGSVVGLAALAVALALAFFAAAIWRERAEIREQGRQRVAESALLFEQHAGRFFDLAAVTLREAVALTPDDRPPNLADWRRLAELRRESPYVEAVWTGDAAGNVTLSVASFPAPDANVAGTRYFRALRDAGERMFVEQITDDGTGRRLLLVARPTYDDVGGFAGFAAVLLDPAFLRHVYEQMEPHFSPFIEVLRAEDFAPVAGWPSPPPGIRATPETAATFAQAARTAPDGAAFVARTGPQADERISALRRIDPYPLFVHVGVSTTALRDQWFAKAAQLASTAGVVLAGLSALAFLAVRRARSERAMKEELRLANEGLEARVAERTQELRDALDEKDVLLKEVHHRVKNNLQVVASLLRLQASKIGNPEVTRAFDDTLERIRAMSVIHELFYRSDSLTRLDLGRYLHELASVAAEAYGTKDRVEVDVEVERSAALVLNALVPLAMCVNEILSNSLKHGFPGDRRGRVEMRLAATDGDMLLTIADDGVGFPPDVEARAGASLGLTLIRALGKQARARVEMRQGPVGACWEVRWTPSSGEEAGGAFEARPTQA